MTKNLFAACRPDEPGLVAKHVRVSQPVQSAVEELFLQQEKAFLEGVTEEVAFDGKWKPEENELLAIPLPDEAKVLLNGAGTNPLGFDDIDTGSFAAGNVRALFVGDGHRTLVQRFAPQQVLSRRFSLLLDNNTFTRLEQPSFALDTHLTCVIRDGKVLFKSFHALRQIIDLFDFYQEATELGLVTFVNKTIFNGADLDLFKLNADQTCRKLIYAITRDGVLDRHSADEIVTAAGAVGLTVGVTNGKLDIPQDRAGLKQLLRFLDDGLFEAPLSGERYVTNSKQKVKAAA
jgi:hypothetical protein